MSEHLTPLDAMFLELEQSDESAGMQIGGVLLFDPVPGGGEPAIERVREELSRRMHALPRFGQRLSSVRTGGLEWPTWEPVDGFDVADHIRRATLPDPGGDTEVFEWLADYYSHRLDRTRPLWEMAVLGGLEGGGWALATKVHHCLVDGVGSVDAGQLLLDPSPRRPRRRPRGPDSVRSAPAPAQASEERQSGSDGLPWWLPPGLLLRGARAGLDLSLHPRRLRDMVDRARSAADLLVRDELIAAPPSSLNVAIGATRRYHAMRLRLDDLKAIKNDLGGTVNDVVLAIAAGGLRHLLLSRNEEPPARGLRAQVPVNIRSAGEQLAMGNRLTSLFVDLPVAEPNPLIRYARVLEEAEALKHGRQPVGGRTLVELTGLAPPALHAYLVRALFDVRLFNLTITNVPGPQSTLYAFGARLREVLPVVPLFARRAVGIAVVSYDGGVVVGLNADRDQVPDLPVLAQGMAQSFAELEARATRTVGAGSPT